MGKRLFAGFMTICMLLSVMPATVHAEEKPTEGELVGTQNEMAAEVGQIPRAASELTDDGVEGAPVVVISEDGTVKTCSTLTEAIAAANDMNDKTVTVEIYGKAEYTDKTENLTGKYSTINFVGKTDDAEISITRDGSGGYISGGEDSNKTVNFTDLTLSKPTGGFANDAGFMNVYFTVYRVAEVNYTNCTFPDGACAAGCEATYDHCNFANMTSGKYSLWVYDNAQCTVTDSEFTGVRGAKMYKEGRDELDNSLTIKNTTFTGVTQKPAIVLTYGKSVDLSGNTYPGTGVFELDADGAPNGTTVTADITDIACNNGDDLDDCGVLVDGKIYVTVTDAVNAKAVTGSSTVTLYYDSAESVNLPAGVTLNKNGYTAAGVETIDANAVSSEAELRAVLAEGVTAIKLDASFSVADSVVIENNVTLDLGGHVISAAADTLRNKPVIRVLAEVTVKNGTVDGTTGINSYAFIVGNNEKSGTLTIEDGEYKGITSAISITDGTVNILGGTFSTAHDGEGTDYGAHYLLNCMDSAYRNGKAVYNITGGTFVGFNPADNESEGANTNFIGIDYEAVQSGTNYVVGAHNPTSVAEVAATCNGTGTKAHYKCATCGKLYSDAAGTTEITAESLVISKGSHSFGSNGKCRTCGYQKQSDATSDSTTTTPSEPVLIALAPTTPSEDVTAKSARTITLPTADEAEETTVETAAAVISEESLVAATALVEEAANEAVVEAVKETVTVTEEKAVVTTETVDKVIENTEAGATVILPLAEAAGEGKTVKEAEVPVESLEKVAEAEASLKVQFEDVEVIFDKETLHAITEQAEGSVIELRVVQIENNELKEEQQAALEGKDVQVTVAAQIYSNGKYIGDFKGGTATLAIPFEPEAGTDAEDYLVYYVADNGDMTFMVSKYAAGHMIVQVDHFSDYVIVYEGAAAEETETPAAEEEPVVEEAPVEETAEEAGMPILPIIIIVVAVIAAVVFFMKKKNDEK